MNNKSVVFRHYTPSDYRSIYEFFLSLNRDNRSHINWNFGRFVWMMDHPSFNPSLSNSIGLWLDKDKVVGLTIFDMYFGEAFVGTLPQYEYLYQEILEYASKELKDENGLGRRL